MPLDRAQMARLQKWLVARNVQVRCPACGGTAFAPGDVVAMPVIEAPEGGFDQPVAMVQLVCDSCACVMLFAAGPIGLA